MMDERILRDQALVLRWYPVTDTSRVVVWFTRHTGKLSTLIKGAQRPKSWVLGQYDLFYTCELLFYALAREDLHHFKECSPLKRRRGLRTNWRGCAAASYITDLLQRTTPPRAAHTPLYDLTSDTLDLFARGESSPLLLFWYELRLLRELGLAPDLGTAPIPEPVFAYEAGRILPRAAAPRNILAPPVTGGTLALLRTLLAEPLPAALTRIRILPEQLRELSAHLEHFITWHLDQPPAARRIALDLMLR